MALEDARDDDPIVGWQIGASEVVCRLSQRHLLALRPGGEFVVLARLAIEPAGLHDLQQHADAMAQLQHPNLGRVHGCISVDEGIFWVTEHFSGATLEEIRAACKKAGKSLPLGLVFATLHEAALALGELHGRHRSHGDVRDANLLVGFAGTSKLLNPGVLDSVQRLPPDPQTDVLALCNLLYQCLTGQGATGPAFAPPSTFNHALEKPVDDLLARALGPDRGKRFKSGAELAQALKAAAGAYMWKPAQRAEFIDGLFRTRHQRTEHVLYNASARLAEVRAARDAEKAAAEVAAFVAPPPPAALTVDDEKSELDFVIDVMPPARAPVVYSVPRRAVMIGAAAAVALVATAALANLISSTGQVPAGAAVLAPPIPVLVPVAAPAPVPAEPPVQVAAADEHAAAAEPAQPERPKVKKKKKSSRDDSPVPPWLMRKGRR